MKIKERINWVWRLRLDTPSQATARSADLQIDIKTIEIVTLRKKRMLKNVKLKRKIKRMKKLRRGLRDQKSQQLNKHVLKDRVQVRGTHGRLPDRCLRVRMALGCLCLEKCGGIDFDNKIPGDLLCFPQCQHPLRKGLGTN